MKDVDKKKDSPLAAPPIPRAPSMLQDELFGRQMNHVLVRFHAIAGTQSSDWLNLVSTVRDDDLVVPRGYVRPPHFQPLPFVDRNGSRQHSYPMWEVPYPVSFDKVMIDTYVGQLCCSFFNRQANHLLFFQG